MSMLSSCSPGRFVDVTISSPFSAIPENSESDGLQGCCEGHNPTENRVCVTPFDYRSILGTGFDLRADHFDREEQNIITEGNVEEPESFLQYCMTCNKQLVPAKNKLLYCSESCRAHDLSTAILPKGYFLSSSDNISHSSLPSLYGESIFIDSSASAGPDIVPRLSPTPPRSVRISLTTEPSNPALESLRSLAISIPQTQKAFHFNAFRVISGAWFTKSFTYKALITRSCDNLPFSQNKSRGIGG